MVWPRWPVTVALGIGIAAGQVDMPRCSHAVVGGGPGGVYAAYRLAMATEAEAKDWKVCLFERSGRLGGRIASIRGLGPRRDLTVDAGAYRYVPVPECVRYGPPGNQTESCEWTPLTKYIVQDLLNLPTELYDPADKSVMRKIVDAKGHNAGYATFVETLAMRAAESGRLAIFLNHEVVRIEKGTNAYPLVLHVQDSSMNVLEVTTGAVLLNLPQLPLLRLLHASSDADPSMIPSPALFAPATYPIMKLYVHYEDAWWRNYLNFTGHVFDNLANFDLSSVGSQFPAPLMGRYWDGDFRCDGPAGACRGFLKAVYAGEKLIVDFYRPHMLTRRNAAAPYQILDAKKPSDKNLLLVVHRSLVAMHAEHLKQVGKLELVNESLPDSAVLSIWSAEAKGFETGCHTLKSPMSSQAHDTADVLVYPNSSQTRLKFLRPLGPDVPIFLANEAYGWPSCWAESSLVMAENAVHEMEGLKRPDWLPEDIYRYVLFDTSGQEVLTAAGSSRGDPFLSLIQDRRACATAGESCVAQRRPVQDWQTSNAKDAPSQQRRPS